MKLIVAAEEKRKKRRGKRKVRIVLHVTIIVFKK